MSIKHCGTYLLDLARKRYLPRRSAQTSTGHCNESDNRSRAANETGESLLVTGSLPLDSACENPRVPHAHA